MSPEEIGRSCRNLCAANRLSHSVQWTLLKGINDTPDEIEGIVKLFERQIRLAQHDSLQHRVDDLPYQRPSWERAAEIARTLHQRGILTN
jgi:23S rRNA (adenine2503-C2)-methyltransferase